MDPNLIVTLNSMQVGEDSKPMQFMGVDGKPGFRILKLKNRIDPHKANLKEDYQKLSLMSAAVKTNNVRKDWIRQKSKTTYIRLDNELACKFENDWYFSN
jgi:peptidyl-prolyl cis-trans isomerase SurA